MYKWTCEWNPDEERAAHVGEHPVEATWSVGRGHVWMLCEECVKLPKFRRFKVIVNLKELSNDNPN